jgi:myo-inositol 2-dehydrogenase/D-chiro-inositol 1-dehydrogenase
VTVRVGVIGTGTIGQDHIRRLMRRVSGAQVVAVSDVNAERAAAVAAEVPGAQVFGTGQELVSDDHVDAVVVAAWGAAHEEFVLAAIEARKPVFCEKPLAPTTASCLRIVDAEVAGGQRLVQVGFMRRYDSGYRAMKEAIVTGAIGAPLVVHCAHRNASAPAYGFTSDLLITDAAIHEIDISRWLLDQEITATRVLTPRRTSHAGPDVQDPQILIFETATGVMIIDEVFVNAGYGYDIRCEVVGESGTVALSDRSDAIVKRDGTRAGRVDPDWRTRFVDAYDTEFRAWVDAVASGGATGPSAWDGYAATAVAVSCLAALETGERTPVQLVDRPGFYTTIGT